MRIRVFFFLISLLAAMVSSQAAEFKSAWPGSSTRTWIGPEYWANRLQDWRVNNGRLECLTAGENRTVHLLPCQVGAGDGSVKLQATLGLAPGLTANAEACVGFAFGVKGDFDDYRDSAVHGRGELAGLSPDNKLRIGDKTLDLESIPESILLALELAPVGDVYSATLTASDADTGTVLGVVAREDIAPEAITGNVALVSHLPGANSVEAPCAWFSQWEVSGEKLDHHPDQTFGPILFSMYTLSKGTLKMTAQMAPVDLRDGQEVVLEVMKDDQWVSLASALIDPVARTATVRVDDWDGSRDAPYRLAYNIAGANGELQPHYWHGTIRKEPTEKDEIVIAAFTGNNDIGFPHQDVTGHVAKIDPDLLFFSGDQLYEGVGGFGTQREPLDEAFLDYLRKWYIFGWAYRDLLRDRPSLAIPDDHDVYHGNIWGAGGKATIQEGTHYEMQDSGGYKMPPEFVNMVQRTQTSHLPDPYDPTPVLQDIGVYYCDMNYGGISFAVLEDRKWKSAPRPLLPEADVVNGWPQNLEFDVKANADVPGAELLGERQLEFLHDWAEDWSGDTWMKVVLSQTIFANVATLPADATSDKVVPKLEVFAPGGYPPNDAPVSDFDSNGWPQTGRNKALREMRRAFALHIAGDQHLGSTIQYGVDEYGDASWAFCVPAVSNVWPRRWFPRTKNNGADLGAPNPYGDFEDGFGNLMTVHAVSNPYQTGRKPEILYDRATGYGVIRLNRKTRDIVMECWARFEDPLAPDAKQYIGWPIRINQKDNYGGRRFGTLATLTFTGDRKPLIQVRDESNGEVIYTIRADQVTFEIQAFSEGTFSIMVSNPDGKGSTVIEGLKPKPAEDAPRIRI